MTTEPTNTPATPEKLNHEELVETILGAIRYNGEILLSLPEGHQVKMEELTDEQHHILDTATMGFLHGMETAMGLLRPTQDADLVPVTLDEFGAALNELQSLLTVDKDAEEDPGFDPTAN